MKPNNEKISLLTFDSETTGLRPEMGATILTFAALHESGESFEVTVQPTEEEWESAHPKALEVNGLTWDDVKDGVPIIDAGDMFGDWMIKHNFAQNKNILLAGQNPGFDMTFMWYFWRDVMRAIGFPTRAREVLDAQTLYIIWAGQVKGKIVKPNQRTSLKNICLAIGIEPEPEPHNALQGASATMRAIQKMSDDIDRVRIVA